MTIIGIDPGTAHTTDRHHVKGCHMPRWKNGTEKATVSLVDTAAWRTRALVAEERLETFTNGLLMNLSGVGKLLHSPKLTLTPGRACRYLGVSRETLLRYERQGHIHPARSSSGRRCYTLEQLDHLLSRGEC